MTTAAERWAEQLAAWAIPDEILEAAPESPWGFPVGLFESRADEVVEQDTPSRRRALEALPDGGSVLDVGCGAGAGGLALVPRAGRVIGLDEGVDMLEAFAARADAAGVDHTEVEGRWPDVADEVPEADVVVCHNVLYNAPDVEPFVRALDTHARRRVVCELADEHPMVWMGPLWEQFHGLERPTGPTADDALHVLRETGFDPQIERFELPRRPESTDVRLVRKRLCLPAERDPEIAEALERMGRPETRTYATLWWDVDGPKRAPKKHLLVP